jgi:hypothetical protein
VPAAGQQWTNLAELGSSRTLSIIEDGEDSRILSINVDPPVGINQTRELIRGGLISWIAFVISTAAGSYLWDCAATISPPLVSYLHGLKQPLKAIAISHPHVSRSAYTLACAKLAVLHNFANVGTSASSPAIPV